MSTAGRLISGSAAAWSRILVMMVSQVVLVPIYLSYWDPETYGVWLAIQSLVIMLTLLDLGHHTYVGFELLKYARVDMVTFCKYLWSSILIGVFVALFELVVIGFLIVFAFVPLLVGESGTMNHQLVSESGPVLLMAGINWVATAAISGLFVRSLEPYGYHARLAWWGVIHLIIYNSVPAIAVTLGASFLQAGVVMTVTSIVFYIPIYIDMFRLMRREKIVFLRPSWRIGYRNFLKSTGVAGKLILENIRQQGVRLIIAPISGAVALTAFSTMRTGANVALQGMSSITSPLMPDLMRFLHERDQLRSEIGFNTIWIVVVGLLAPAVIVLQTVVEPLFELWTHGRVEFDPLLFAMISLSVLIFAITQPAIAVVMGNNLIRPQLIMSALSAATVIGLVILLVPRVGLPGAGIAVVAAEAIAAVGYIYTARRWLMLNEMRWPNRSFTKSITSVVIAALAMISISYFPSVGWIICIAGLVLCLLNFISYWHTLPSILKIRAWEIVRTVKSKVRRKILQYSGR